VGLGTKSCALRYLLAYGILVERNTFRILCVTLPTRGCLALLFCWSQWYCGPHTRGCAALGCFATRSSLAPITLHWSLLLMAPLHCCDTYQNTKRQHRYLLRIDIKIVVDTERRLAPTPPRPFQLLVQSFSRKSRRAAMTTALHVECSRFSRQKT